MKLNRNKLLQELRPAPMDLLAALRETELRLGSSGANDWLRKLVTSILDLADKQIEGIEPAVQSSAQEFWDKCYLSIANNIVHNNMRYSQIGEACDAALIARRKRHEA